MDQASPPAEQALAPRNAGRFRPGQSGNPRGRRPKPQFRTDGYANPYTGHGTGRDRRVFTDFRVDVVSPREAIALWRSEFLAKRIIEALPEEAFRRGWALKIDGASNTKRLAERVTARAEELHLDERLVQAAQHERAEGGAALFPVVDGAQGDLSTPLIPTSVSRVTAFHLLESRELQPVTYYGDIRSPQFGQPEVYRFSPLMRRGTVGMGTQYVHASRLIVFSGAQVSKEPQPGQLDGWGDSVLTPCKQVLADFGLAWGSAATLLHEHGLGVLAMDGLADLLAAADGQAVVDRRVSAMMMGKSSLKALLVDGKDTYTRLASSLSGLAEVLNEFKQLISGAAETPVSILLGMAQSGLRTGDDDTRSWYASVEKKRARRYKPRHEQALRFLLLEEGNEPDVWSVEYPSLWTPSEKEQAETRKTDMERAKAAIEAGIASADDVAESFYGGDTYSPDIRIDWERRRAQAKIDEERAAMLEQDPAALEAMGREQNEGTEGDGAVPPPDQADQLRGDGVGGGYNPYRAKDGKFAPGAHKAPERGYGSSLGGARPAAAPAAHPAAPQPRHQGRPGLGSGHASGAQAGHSQQASGHHSLAPHPQAAHPGPASRSTATTHHEHPTAADAARQAREAKQAQVIEHAKQNGQATPGRTAEKGEIGDAEHGRMQSSLYSKMNSDERYFATLYTETDAVWSVNNSLRGLPPPKGSDFNRVAEMTPHLDSMIAKSPPLESVATVYRGVKAGTPLDRLRPGDTFTDRAYGSTSTRPDLAHRFAQESGSGSPGTLVRITLPAGTRAAAVPSRFQGEQEILLHRGHKLRVDRVVKSSIEGGPTEMFATLVE